MNMTKWVDGQKYKNVPLELQEYFSAINPSSGLRSLQYVGVILKRKRLDLFLPKNTIPDSVNQSDIRLLIDVLIAYQNRDSSLGSGSVVQCNDLFPIVEWLVTDFIQNGLLLNTMKVTKHQYNGKIDWNTTIKKVLPTVIQEEPILTTFYKTKSFVQQDFLTLIQKSVLADISANYGVLFDFSYNVAKPYDLTNSSNKDKAVIFLKKQLRYVNEIRKRQLIKQLLAYIASMSGSQEISIVTTEFHVIFEKAMKAYFHHDKDLERFVPKAHWHITIDNHNFSPINNQIPDALVLRAPFVDIYDAKYYNFSVPRLSNTYPPLDWYSVGKQFFYSLSFDYHGASMQRGTNNFVFPVYPLKDDYQKVGMVSISTDGIHDINVIQANTFKLLKTLT